MRIAVGYFICAREPFSICLFHRKSSFRSCQIFFMSGRKLARKRLAHFRLRRNRRGENLVEPASSASSNRDLKILDAAAFKKAVTSERAWVVTATFAREIRALRFALCKRSPKHITTDRFTQRITGIRRFCCYDVV